MWLSPHAAAQAPLYAARSSGVVRDGAAGIAAPSRGTRPRTHASPSPGTCAQELREVMHKPMTLLKPSPRVHRSMLVLPCTTCSQRQDIATPLTFALKRSDRDWRWRTSCRHSISSRVCQLRPSPGTPWSGPPGTAAPARPGADGSPASERPPGRRQGLRQCRGAGWSCRPAATRSPGAQSAADRAAGTAGSPHSRRPGQHCEGQMACDNSRATCEVSRMDPASRATG